MNEAGATSGSAASKAEVHKHNANNLKCRELVTRGTQTPLAKCFLASPAWAAAPAQAPTSDKGGKKDRHRISIDTLCQEWSRGNEKSLWTAVVSRACKSHQSKPIPLASTIKEPDHVQSDHAKLKSAITFGNTDTKPVQLQADFNLLAVLWSFKKATACGPSGMRIQHFLDVASVPLPRFTHGPPGATHNIQNFGILSVQFLQHQGFSKLAADPQFQQLLLNAWYLDDGALAGPGSAVLRALEVISSEGKPNGLILNLSKCELFSPNADIFQLFDSSIPTSTTPNFEILGAPIGSPEFCGDYIEAKRKQACSILHLLPQLCDPQVSILLLRHCASFSDSKCPLCSSALDPDCHHALTCRFGGDIIARHNKLRDCFANLCSKACSSPQLENGPGLDFSRPADVLVPNWSLSNPAAFDLNIIHPLNTDLILEASLASGNSAEFGEIGKHTKNDQMCRRLGWTFIPLVVEVNGGWGCEAQGCFSRLSKRLAMQVGVCEPEALSQMYCLLGVTLMRQNARAILLRCAQTPLQDC
eukprot:Em0037g38a